MAMKNSKRNNTTLFLLPLLGLSKAEVMDEGFKNTYIDDNYLTVIGHKNVSFESTYDVKRVLPLFAKGSYSEIPNNLKQKILTFWGITSKEERLYHILYPNQFYIESFSSIPRKFEIWPRPDMSEETLITEVNESNTIECD